MENINWYPGHMKKTRELIQNNMKMVDLAVEVIDSRIPVSSRNPVIRELTGGKLRIIVLNKADLSNPEENKRWKACLRSEGTRVLEMNSMTGEGTRQLYSMLEKIKTNGGTARQQKPLRMMILGIPNVGKSSLINRMTGKRSTRVGDRPGVTRGKQWLTLKNGMQLLDTPGILWPKLGDQKIGLALAFCGSIKDEILDTAELGLEFIRFMCREYPELLCQRYKLEEVEETPLATMEKIAKKRGFILPGKRIDYERCGRTVIDEFREGKIGRITLEPCPVQGGEKNEESGTGADAPEKIGGNESL